MIALVQRVAEASVTVDEEIVGRIGQGLLVLIGIHRDDTEQELAWVARKCALLRVFPDDDGVMNRSVLEAGGDVLAVSQFTLYGAVGKGNRPSYNHAAPPGVAARMFEAFVARLEDELGREVQTGRFQAHMQVHLVNDGPVTIWIERAPPSGAE
ncbi:MAG: D-aminoacyl-tRNA deacylase [Rhodothermales bacterium]